MPKQPFLTHIATLRRRARRHSDENAITSSCDAERDAVRKLLNDALADLPAGQA